MCLFGLTAFSQKVSNQKGIAVQDTIKKTKPTGKTDRKHEQFLRKKLDSIAKINVELPELDRVFEVRKDSVSESFQLFKTSAVVSYYADKFHGRKTASGQVFDNKKRTAAHRTLPFGTRLKVTNEANGKSVEVVVNDRGPFAKGRELDLSKAAFLEITRDVKYGLLRATIEIVE